MTQEEKKLLLVDLCARLPYHIRVKVWLKDGTTEEGFFDFEHNYGDAMMDFFFYNKLKDLKPYLRPMSSMTEEEREECVVKGLAYIDSGKYEDEETSFIYGNETCQLIPNIDTYDWLNSHHFDYRGLIEKGLALEAPEEIYKEKQNDTKDTSIL